MVRPPAVMIDRKEVLHVHFLVEEIGERHFPPRFVRVDPKVKSDRICRQRWIEFEFGDLMAKPNETVLEHGLEFSPARHRRAGKEISQQNFHWSLETPMNSPANS